METRRDKTFTERVEVPEASQDTLVEFVGDKLRSPGSKNRLVTDIEIGRCDKEKVRFGTALPISVICKTVELH